MRSSIIAALGAASVVNAGYNAGYNATTPSSTTSASYGTPSCAAPGTNDSQGRYSCNPAHSYPAGQTCVLVNGCFVLQKSTSSYSAVVPPSPTPSCPAPGAYDNKGRYSCNPAHSYPAGQTCNLIDGCYFLCNSGTPITKSYTASSTSYSASTPSCPAAGSTDSQGRYSCNPAHQYPAGQTCVAVNGCYYLTKTTVTTTSASYSAHPTPSCPAAGSTDSKGRYSCNPAHQYPAGQTCVAVDGCYYLTKTSTTSVVSVPATTSAARPTMTQYYTGGASKAAGFGGLAAVFGVAVLAL